MAGAAGVAADGLVRMRLGPVRRPSGRCHRGGPAPARARTASRSRRVGSGHGEGSRWRRSPGRGGVVRRCRRPSQRQRGVLGHGSDGGGPAAAGGPPLGKHGGPEADPAVRVERQILEAEGVEGSAGRVLQDVGDDHRAKRLDEVAGEGGPVAAVQGENAEARGPALARARREGSRDAEFGSRRPGRLLSGAAVTLRRPPRDSVAHPVTTGGAHAPHRIRWPATATVRVPRPREVRLLPYTRARCRR